MTSLTIAQAKEGLAVTAGISEIVHPFADGSHDFVYDEDEGNPTLTLNLGGEPYRIDQHALTAALAFVPGAGAATAERWPLRMLMEPLNWFFDNKKGAFKVLAIGNDVVTFTKPTALLFDPVEVLEAMADTVAEHGGKETVVVSNFAHTVEATRFNVHVPNGQSEQFVEARPGDKTLGGLAFSGSLLGKTKAELAVYTHRVECANGMISPDGVSRFSLGHGDDDADGTLNRLYEWLASTTAELYTGESMATEFTRIAHLTHHEVDSNHTAEVLGDLFSRLKIPVASRAEILEAVLEEGDGTMYGLVQSMTRAAEHSQGLTEDARDRLMRDAGLATMQAQDICGSCRRPVHA